LPNPLANGYSTQQFKLSASGGDVWRNR